MKNKRNEDRAGALRTGPVFVPLIQLGRAHV